MRPINISENKILKLQNVLSHCIVLSEENADSLNLEIDKMNIYLQTHGARQIGPMIQYSKVEQNENGMPSVKIAFMLQGNKNIEHVEEPYQMDEILKVKNCLYARYIGPEENLNFAYDKLGVYAFENEINLNGDNYTIFVDKSDDEDITADIFMPVRVE